MSNRRAAAAAIVVAASIAWAAALVAAPYLLQQASHDSALFGAAGFTYLMGSFLCHQDPARSFHLLEAQLPVCARCTGLYLAAPAGALAAIAGIGRAHGERAQGTPGPLRTVLIASAVPAALTWVAESLLGWPVPGTVRALASAPLALVVGWIVASAAGGHLR